jgi:hypothetical protein
MWILVADGTNVMSKKKQSKLTRAVAEATKKLNQQKVQAGEPPILKSSKVEKSKVEEAPNQVLPQLASILRKLLPRDPGVAAGISTLPVREQMEIARLYLQYGRSITYIARELHRDRETVSRVVHSEGMQAAKDSAMRRLVGYAHHWVDALNFAVDTEENGAMSFKLSERFGIIPGPQPKLPGGVAGQDYADQPILDEDAIFQDMKKACAYEIGRVAMERHDVYGSSLPAEMDELEAMVKQRQEKKASQREQKKEN